MNSASLIEATECKVLFPFAFTVVMAVLTRTE